MRINYKEQRYNNMEDIGNNIGEILLELPEGTSMAWALACLIKQYARSTGCNPWDFLSDLFWVMGQLAKDGIMPMYSEEIPSDNITRPLSEDDCREVGECLFRCFMILVYGKDLSSAVVCLAYALKTFCYEKYANWAWIYFDTHAAGKKLFDDAC